MKIVISNIGYKTKPVKHISDDEFQLLENYSTYTQINVRQFAQLCADGHTFFPAYFKKDAKRRNIPSCEGVWVIALDFDGAAVHPEEFVAYAESIGIIPNFYYYTFSQDRADIDLPEDKIVHKSKNYGSEGELKASYRYRIVWVLDEEISLKTFGELIKVLMHDTFKDFNCDKGCKDPSRLFFGSNTYAVVVNPEPTKLSSLGWAKIMEVSRQGKANRTVHNQKAAGAQDWEEVEVPEAITVDSKWMDKLRPYCDLLDKWMLGGYIDYNQRLTLWSNLRFLKRKSPSQTIADDLMRFVVPEEYEGHTFSRNEIMSKFRDSKLKPAPIVKYHGERMDVVKFFTEYTNAAIEVKQEGYSTLEELDQWMDENVGRVINDKGFTYFKAQTASGKTERIIQALVNNSFFTNKIIYAVPTHILAKEIEERLNKAIEEQGVELDVYRVPQREYTDLDLLLLQLGLSAQMKDEARSQAIEKLYDKKSRGIFIITHSLLVNLNNNLPVDLIIVDENLEDALITNIKITESQLSSLLIHVQPKDRARLISFMDTFKDAKVGDVLPDDLKEIISNIDTKEYIRNITEDDVIEKLFRVGDAECLRKSNKGKAYCVRALCKSSLINTAINRNIPIKLFTATPMSQRLKNYYGLTFEIVEPSKPAKNTGKVKQYRGITGARGISQGKGIEKNKFEKYNKYIQTKLTKEQIKKALIISFKGAKQLFEDAGYTVAVNDGQGEIHFMNNAGLDFMKGRDIIIVGKYDRPDEYYYDLWVDIRPEGDDSMPYREKQKIYRNGVWQTLYLWNKEELRNEQLEYMEYTHQQAIGRARALREDATVYLFSDYVPAGVDEIFD